MCSSIRRTRTCPRRSKGSTNSGGAARITVRLPPVGDWGDSDVTAAFVQLLGGVFTLGLFSLDLGGGNAVRSTGHSASRFNWRATVQGQAYYGDLEFTDYQDRWPEDR